MKLKIILINILIFVLLLFIADLFFSKFVFKQSVDHKCYQHTEDGRFYKMRKNCFANMRLISSIESFKVYINEDGNRFSGKKREKKDNNIVFLGDSQTFGIGSNWEDTFIGLIEKKIPNYNYYNLGVPSYSPTVYKYALKQFINSKKIKIKKVYVLIDLTDVADESNRWREINGKPRLEEKKIIRKERSKFSKFKKENFKGIYLMSSNIRSFLRKIKNKKKKTKKNEYRPVDGNPTGSYIYTDHKTLTGCHEKDQKNEFWKCGDVEFGLKKVRIRINELSEIVQSLNSEFYIIIMPWPDTLNFGQTEFNWENFAQELCLESKCKKLINMFPDFRNIKNKNEKWLKTIYLQNDIHLSKKGNSLLAEKLILESF